MKKVLIKIFFFLMNVIYLFIKLRPVKKQVTLVSRESNRESLDFAMLRIELEETYGYKVVVLSKTFEKTAIGLVAYGFHMLRQMWEFAASKVVIADTYCIIISNLKHRKNLRVVQIWHAISAIKKFGYQTVGKNDGAKKEIAKLMNMHKGYDYVISASEETDNFFSEAFGIDKKNIVRQGLPRIDYIRKVDQKQTALILKEYPSLAESNRKIILYAPTIRKGRGIDLHSLFSAFRDDEYIFIVKLHPLDNCTVKVKKDNVIYDDKFIPYDFLHLADCVISDYSSFAVEASLVDKRLYFYLYDYDEYKKFTGINIDFDKEAIHPYVAKDTEELIKIIEREYNSDLMYEFRYKYVDKSLSNVTKRLGAFIDCI